MQSVRVQLFHLFVFITLCGLPAAVVAITDWERFGYQFIIGGMSTFALTSLSFLPVMVGPAPRSLFYGAVAVALCALLIVIRVYFYAAPVSVVDLSIPACLIAAVILLGRYCYIVGGFTRSWRDVVAAIATVLGAEAGFIWGIVTAPAQ
jgi:hypothetical protein